MIHSLFILKEKEMKQTLDETQLKATFNTMNETEHVYLSLLAERGQSINRDSIQTAVILPNLVKAELIPDTHDAVFMIPVELINMYNKLVLNNQFPVITEPSEQESINEQHAFEDNKKVYDEQMAMEESIDQMIQTYSNLPLKEHLKYMHVENIAAILKFYNLTAPTEEKEVMINTIVDNFLKDFTMLKKMIRYMDYELLLNIENAIQFDYDNFTYLKGATREIFLYAHTFNEILFMPSDVLQHFKNYIQEKGYLNPDLVKIKFYRGMMNLYGFVPITHMQMVYEKLYKEPLDRATILADIQTFFPNLVRNMKGNWIKHELYTHQDLNLDEMFANMEYYVPIKKEHVYKFVQNSFVEPSKASKALKVELKRNMKGEHIYNQQIEALFSEIIETFRVTDSFETAFEFVADLGAKNMISIVPTTELTKLLKEVYTEVRLWRLGGKKVIEMPEYRRTKVQVVSSKKKKKKKK